MQGHVLVRSRDHYPEMLVSKVSLGPAKKANTQHPLAANGLREQSAEWVASLSYVTANKKKPKALLQLFRLLSFVPAAAPKLTAKKGQFLNSKPVPL